MHVASESSGLTQMMRFTGSELVAFGRHLRATCLVRNELNRWRKSHEVVRTIGSSVPNGLPYYPRPFPPGSWEITRVQDIGPDTAYWPVFLDTPARQELPIWELDDHGRYLQATTETFVARGYLIHHARHRINGEWVASNTTYGCINVLEVADMEWLAGNMRHAFGMRMRVFVDVPAWEEWE